MRGLVIFLTMGWLLTNSALRAGESDVTRKTELPGAVVTELQTGNVLRLTLSFETRRVVVETLVNGPDRTPLRTDFGRAGADAADDKPLLEPAWLVDANGDGFYFPSQPDFTVRAHPAEGVFALEETTIVPESTRRSFRLEFAKTSASDMGRIAGDMVNPVLAPLQITENDDDELIVYDTATRTTAYAIERPSDRMNSAGYLSGSSQPCVVLIRSGEDGITLSAGKAGPPGKIRLKLFGEWTPAPGSETSVTCQPKAGRTWIELNAGSDGSAAIELKKLPNIGYVQRLLELFLKK